MGTITIKDGTEILRPSPSGRSVLGRWQKAEPRSEHRHVASTFKPQWKGVEQSSRSAGDYWQPCNSTFHAYIVNNCD